MVFTVIISNTNNSYSAIVNYVIGSDYCSITLLIMYDCGIGFLHYIIKNPCHIFSGEIASIEQTYHP